MVVSCSAALPNHVSALKALLVHHIGRSIITRLPASLSPLLRIGSGELGIKTPQLGLTLERRRDDSKMGLRRKNCQGR